MSGYHAPMSPSKLFRILECPGSYTLCQGRKEGRQSPQAAEGTLLHLTCERHTQANIRRAGEWSIIPFSPDIVAPSLDKEQITTVQEALEYIDITVNAMDEPPIDIMLEGQVGLSKYNSRLADIWGTGDVIIRTTNTLHVFDYKFGGGIFVDVNNNDQLLSYGAGAAETVEQLNRFKSISIHVVQPRKDNYALETRTPSQIMSWINGRVLPGVDRALSKNPEFNPGEKQCMFCLAKNVCVARLSVARQGAQNVFAQYKAGKHEASLKEIATLVKDAEIYMTVIKDLKKYIASSIQQGKDVPGYKMVAGRNNRHWISEEAAIDFCVDNNIEEDEMYPPKKFLGPAAIEKLDRRFKKDKDFKALYETKPGAPSLVQESSPKPALNYKSAAEVFKNVKK